MKYVFTMTGVVVESDTVLTEPLFKPLESQPKAEKPKATTSKRTTKKAAPKEA